jgi:hypothetical protein
MTMLFDSEQNIPRSAPRRSKSSVTQSPIAVYFSIPHSAFSIPWSAS